MSEVRKWKSKVLTREKRQLQIESPQKETRIIVNELMKNSYGIRRDRMRARILDLF